MYLFLSLKIPKVEDIWQRTLPDSGLSGSVCCRTVGYPAAYAAGQWAIWQRTLPDSGLSGSIRCQTLGYLAAYAAG